MRSGAGFNATFVASAAVPMSGQSHSVWHSPVQYLFGGLAAMLGLIAFALLLLACSFWKISSFLDGGGNEADTGSRDGKLSDEPVKESAYFCEGIVVIMAGEKNPTFLATPIASRDLSFEEERRNISCSSSR